MRTLPRLLIKRKEKFCLKEPGKFLKFHGRIGFTNAHILPACVFKCGDIKKDFISYAPNNFVIVLIVMLCNVFVLRIDLVGSPFAATMADKSSAHGHQLQKNIYIIYVKQNTLCNPWSHQHSDKLFPTTNVSHTLKRWKQKKGLAANTVLTCNTKRSGELSTTVGVNLQRHHVALKMRQNIKTNGLIFAVF